MTARASRQADCRVCGGDGYLATAPSGSREASECPYCQGTGRDTSRPLGRTLRCSGTTASGGRCQRPATPGWETCAQHRAQHDHARRILARDIPREEHRVEDTHITIHGPTFTGSYNLIGLTEEDGFCLQGNLTLDQLRELRRVIDEKLAEVSA